MQGEKKRESRDDGNNINNIIDNFYDNSDNDRIMIVADDTGRIMITLS